MTAAPAVPRGLAGVVVTDTVLGDVRGEEGFFHYRDRDATVLAEHHDLEAVWQLVLDGALPPSAAAADDFRAEVRAQRALPAAVAAALPALVAADGAPVSTLRTGLSLVAGALGMRPVLDLSPGERRRDVLALAARVPTLVAAAHRIASGAAPVPPRSDLGHGANLLWMVSGEEPDARSAAALERYLVLTVDHGFNASTFTARVVASTGADAGACLVAGLGALSGPLHGGAPSRVLDLLDEIEAAGGEAAVEAVLRAKLDGRERLMGFGHAVYRTTDPRSALLARTAAELGGRRAALAARVLATAEALLAERHPERPLRANVELYAAVVLDAVGLPRPLFTPTFAISRSIGWGAHVLEQAAEGKLIRPSARYVGPPVR